MRKEARDGEGNVMPEDELRDEMALGRSPCFFIPVDDLVFSI